MIRVRFRDGPATLSERARKGFQLAHQEAHRLNHPAVGVVHLLIGLTKEGLSPASVILHRVGFDLVWLRRQVEELCPPCADTRVRPGWLPYTTELEGFLGAVIEAAESSGVTLVTPEHLLAALIREPDGIAARILGQRSWALWRLHRRLRRAVG